MGNPGPGKFPAEVGNEKRETGAEFRAKLAADPRFAMWAARDTTPDIGPLADPVYPDVARRHTERNELRRVAAVSALRNGGKHLTPQQVAVNRFWAGLSPLAGPLSDGEPAK
jgi:hypothetical protein